MPLYFGSRDLIFVNLTLIAGGDRPAWRAIGCFSDGQFSDLNSSRKAIGLHTLDSNQILFLGRHLYASRTADGYSIDDMVEQIESALCEDAVATFTEKMSCTRNQIGRDDGYGNRVFDQAVFEMTAKRPKAELFSVIPKGDDIKPKK